VFPGARLLATYVVTFPTSNGVPYLPEVVPIYTLYPARLELVTALQVNVAVAPEVVTAVVEEPEVVVDDEVEVVVVAPEVVDEGTVAVVVEL
jgi:hypothetical protein